MLQIVPATCALTARARTLICINGQLLPPAVALAALNSKDETPKTILAVSKYNAFIVDSGSGHHLVGRQQVDETRLTKVDPDKALRLQTANGITSSVFKTRLYIKQLKTHVDAWVLEDAPLVLSVDKLVAGNNSILHGNR